MTKALSRIQQARQNLEEWVKEGDTIYTVIRSVSRSGMSRRIDVMKFDGGRRIYLTTCMADLGLAGMKMSMNDWAKSRGASIPGCGMDMGFHAVDTLCYAIFQKSSHDANVRHEWI